MNDLEPLRFHLNRETARVQWSEVERYFAKGDLLWVAPSLDLVTVAATVAADRRAALQDWLDAGQVAVMSDRRAQYLSRDEGELWAVVVAPWVLVQDRAQSAG